MNGRREPYTAVGIRRLPCCRCGKPSTQQWQICADDNLYRPICWTCDMALNRMVLEFIGFSEAEIAIKMSRYTLDFLGFDRP